MERHILVFHNSWSSTRKRRLFSHYLPLIIIILYVISYYTWVIFFPPCENTYYYSLPACGAVPYHLNDPIIGLWESDVHGCAITMIIIIFSIGLVIRAIAQKRLRHQRIEWRNHGKMIFQMVWISSVFIIFNLPISIMFILHLTGVASNLWVELQSYFLFTTYWLLLFLPFVCLNSLPDLKQKLKKMFGILRRHQATIAVVLPSNR